MTTENTELATIETTSTSGLLASLDAMRNGGSLVVTTFEESGWDTKLATFDAMTNAARVDENFGTVINLRNWVVQPVDMPVDDKDPSKGTALAPRVILIDEDGTSFAAISSGILKSLENLVGVFGKPSAWPGSIPVVVTEERGRSGYRYMTLSIYKGDKAAAKAK